MSPPPKNMHENLPLGASPPAAKNNETAFLTQEVFDVSAYGTD